MTFRQMVKVSLYAADMLHFLDFFWLLIYLAAFLFMYAFMYRYKIHAMCENIWETWIFSFVHFELLLNSIEAFDFDILTLVFFFFDLLYLLTHTVFLVACQDVHVPERGDWSSHQTRMTKMSKSLSKRDFFSLVWCCHFFFQNKTRHCENVSCFCACGMIPGCH